MVVKNGSRPRRRVPVAVKPPEEELPGVPRLPKELEAVVSGIRFSPQERAKMVRQVYSTHPEYREEHGSVRAFLEKHGVPIVDTPPSQPEPGAARARAAEGGR